MKTILIPMANGNEDIELISTIDVLRRARDLCKADLNIICASIHDSLEITLDSGLKVLADTKLSDIDTTNIDAIALAGGFEGMNNFKNNAKIIEILKDLKAKGKLIAAICASPMVLDAAGVLSDTFTCYPGCEAGIKATRVNKPVVVKDNVITSAGPITSTYFALSIVKELGFIDAYNGLVEGLLVKDFGIEF